MGCGASTTSAHVGLHPGESRKSDNALVLHVVAKQNLAGWTGKWIVPPLFWETGKECCHELSKYVRPIMYGDGEFIFHTGDQGSTMYFVNSGAVSVQIRGHEVARLLPGSYFGELGLMLQDGRKADAVCDGDSELLELDRPDFYHVLEKHPILAGKMYDNMSAEVKAHIKRAAEETAVRHHQYLEHAGEDDLVVSRLTRCPTLSTTCPRESQTGIPRMRLTMRSFSKPTSGLKSCSIDVCWLTKL